MDTNVLIAALRSRRGASFEVFRRLRLGQWTAVISNHLLYEYEEIMGQQSAALRLTTADIDQLLNAICARSVVSRLTHVWQPVLTDADDEPLVQLACESAVYRIVSHNVRHLEPAIRLGVEILKPRDFLAMLDQRK